MFSSEFMEEMTIEMLQHMSFLETWNLIPPEKVPPEEIIFGNKFVFSVKSDNGQPIRKARFVQLGNKDKTSTKEETTSTVASIRTIYIQIIEFLHDPSSEAYIRNWDFTNAYGTAKRMRPVYLKQHRLFMVEGKEEWIMELDKGLQGGKPAGRGFQMYSKNVLVNHNKFKQCPL